MKNKFTYAILFPLVFFISIKISAQEVTDFDGGPGIAAKNNSEHPCITKEEYETIEKKCEKNCHLLGLENHSGKSPMNTLFSWPLRTNNLSDCSYYTISNYVDQDQTTGIRDFNCGSTTYDGHKGTDISTWPFHFLKMDNDQVEVIAAAPGTIIDKADGAFDKNCAMGSNPANYVIIQHADGSRALYWHMKMNSILSKAIGQTVSTGEYLGVVGSSGSSTAPHLHFEIWANSASTSYLDPYSGTCNTLNSTSWWNTQKPYTEPAIERISIATAAPVFPTCPGTETTNEAPCFPAGGNAKFVIYLRDETSGMTATLRILRPNLTAYATWTHDCTSNYTASYWWWSYNLPTTPGTYTFEVTFNGITCTKTFVIDCSTLSVADKDNGTSFVIFPNPANNEFHIAAEEIENGKCLINLKTITGQTVLSTEFKIENNILQKDLSVSQLPDGIYFLTLETDKTKIVRKIIVQNK
jgi:murein DD-endopeptidase MepM/ murein hydrolase activator NlpD